MMFHLYQLFDQCVKEAFLQNHIITHQLQPTIEFLYRNVFIGDFLLQLTWDKQQVNWYRSRWLKEKDEEVIKLWWEYAQKDDFQALQLTFSQEKGVIKLSTIQKLLQLIHCTKLPLLLAHEEKGKDGSLIWFSFRIGTLRYTIEWQTCDTPKEWEDLEHILTELLHINTLLPTE